MERPDIDAIDAHFANAHMSGKQHDFNELKQCLIDNWPEIRAYIKELENKLAIK